MQTAPQMQPQGYGQQGAASGFTGLGSTAGAAPVSVYADLVEVRGAAGPAQMIGMFFLVLLLAAGGYAAYEFFVNDHNPLDDLAALFGGEVPVETPAGPVPKTSDANTPETAAQTMTTTPETGREPEIPAEYGPYALLPNALEGRRVDGTRAWTAAEEEGWRAGLSHRYTYQRYKTVRDVVSMKLAGSEAILWDALEEKKLWTRMRAAMGLADMGIAISTTVVEKALGKSRPEAIEGYFKRFTEAASPGERYVMKEALKVAPPIARIVILQALNHWNDKDRDLYFAAAGYDDDVRVQRYIDRAADERAIPQSAIDRFVKLASMDPESLRSQAKPTGTGAAPQGQLEDQSGFAPQVDGPEALEALETGSGWDAYAGEDGIEANKNADNGDAVVAGGEVEFFNTDVLKEEPGIRKKKAAEKREAARKRAVEESLKPRSR